MYIDDIRLYRPRYVPDKGIPLEADFNSNGIVGFRDLEIMVSDWLTSSIDLDPDLNVDSMVDFKDYAILADHWLDGQLWPE
jgi:hypothetical protein